MESKYDIVVVGGGHVGRAVAHMAKWLGFRVVVSDDREAFATPESVPDADEHIFGPLAELPWKARITPNTYVLLVTRGVDVIVVVTDGSKRSEVTLGIIAGMTDAAPLAVIANRSRTGDRIKLPVGAALLGTVPEDDTVGQFDREGRPLSELPPENAALCAVRNIAERLCE